MPGLKRVQSNLVLHASDNSWACVVRTNHFCIGMVHRRPHHSRGCIDCVGHECHGAGVGWCDPEPVFDQDTKALFV